MCVTNHPDIPAQLSASNNNPESNHYPTLNDCPEGFRTPTVFPESASLLRICGEYVGWIAGLPSAERKKVMALHVRTRIEDGHRYDCFLLDMLGRRVLQLSAKTSLQEMYECERHFINLEEQLHLALLRESAHELLERLEHVR